MNLQRPVMRGAPRYATFLALSLVALLSACGEGTGVGAGTPPPRSTAPGSPVYTAIIDAGSSGTRINFYRVVAGAYPKIDLLSSQDFDDNGINDYLNGTGTIEPTEWKGDATKNIVTGLPDGYAPPGCAMTKDSTTGGEAEVGPCVLQPLLDAIKTNMETEGVTADKVTVELFATAGMRTMEKFNGGSFTSEQITKFYNTMKTYTQTKGFGVGDFRTSNGNKEEGVWTWVNLNDQYYNAFGGNTTYHAGAPETRGDFEVGGSSMQVAFPTTTIAVGDANNVYPVSINGKTYNVFSKTYLGLGGDDTRKFMRAYGYSNAATAAYTGIDCFGSNAMADNSKEDSGVTLFNAPQIFPNSAAPAGNATGVTWTTILLNAGANTPLILRGKGRYNFKTCAAKYNEVTQAAMALPRNNNGTNYEGGASSYSDLAAKIAQSSAPFVGLDNFYFATNDLKLVPKGQVKTPITEAQVKTAIATVCPDNGAGPEPRDPNKPNLKDFRVCPDAAYMYSFLWQGNTAESPGLFGPGRTAKYDGVVPSKFNKQSVLTWSRGYLLLKYSK